MASAGTIRRTRLPTSIVRHGAPEVAPDTGANCYRRPPPPPPPRPPPPREPPPPPPPREAPPPLLLLRLDCPRLLAARVLLLPESLKLLLRVPDESREVPVPEFDEPPRPPDAP